MNLTLRPFGPGSILALLVLIFAVLGMFGIIPFTALIVFGMIAILTLGFFF
jgi:hypothetical protein